VFLLLTRAVMHLGGDPFTSVRWYGLAERGMVVFLLTLLLGRRVVPGVALMLGVLSGFLLGTLAVDLVHSYYQTTLVLGLLVLWALVRSVEDGAPHRGWVAAGGALAALTFFAKQSNGLAIVAGCSALGLFAGYRLRWLVPFLGGAAVPTAGFLGWLAANDALVAFGQQVFGGAGSKGSWSTILSAFFLRAVADAAAVPVSTAIVVALLVVAWTLGRGDRGGGSVPALGMFVVAVVSVAAFLYPYLVPGGMLATPLTLWTGWPGVLLVGFLSAVAIFILDLRRTLRREDGAVVDLLVSSFSLLWMVGHGMSGLLQPPALVLAAPWGLARGLAGLSSPRIRRAAEIAVLAASFLLIERMSDERYRRQYYWWGWVEPPVWMASEVSSLPELRGLKLSAETRAVYEGATAFIRERTTPADEVWFFPHISVFNVLAGRRNHCPSPIAYFDVCDDACARRAARWLLEARPKLIIAMTFPEEAWQEHERLFRGGGRSGQREIQAVIDGLVADGTYEVPVTVTRVSGYPIRFLERKDGHDTPPDRIPDERP